MLMPFMLKYLEIPNVSKAFDPQWEKNRYQDKAIDCLKEFFYSLKLKDAVIR